MEQQEVSRPIGWNIPLVFLHGLKACHLVEKASKERFYVTKSSALNLSSPPLGLPMEWDGLYQKKDSLVPEKPISSLLGVQVYKPFLQMAKSLGRPFYKFSYDWRRDNSESVEQFRAFLEYVVAKTKAELGGDGRAQVVGHSNGGLIAYVLLNQRPDLFHSCVFAGTPFGGCMYVMTDFHMSQRLGLNYSLLSKKVLFTFPTTYSFFALNPEESGLITADGKNISADMFAVGEWKFHQLGIFSPNAKDPSKKKDIGPEKIRHMQKCLKVAKRFRKRIVYDPAVKYPPIISIIGTGRPCLAVMIKNGPKSFKGWDCETVFKPDGDGVVPALHAVPPEGVPYEVVLTKKEHTFLLNGPRVRDILENLILGEPVENMRDKILKAAL